MSYAICITTKLLNEMLALPSEISRKIAPAIRSLQQDPYSEAKKLKSQQAVYRIRIGHDYRLIYKIAAQQLTLLTIGHRNDVYKRILDSEGQIHIEAAIAPQPEVQPVGPLITEAQLRQWRIPQAYWQGLLNLKHPDELLELEIPSPYSNQILDILVPTQLDHLEAKPVVALTNLEDLDRLMAGEVEISAFLLPLNPIQEKLKTLRSQKAVLVKGAAGTGKSLLAIYRAQYLAQQGYPKILYATYTESLAAYSNQLLRALLRQEPGTCGITVKTVDQVALDYYEEQYPPPLLPEDGGLLLLKQVIQSDRSLYQQHHRWIDRLGYSYWLEEITLVIEAHNISSQTAYLNTKRVGRKVPLNQNQRIAVWNFYKAWVRVLKDAGYTSLGKIHQDALAIVQQKNSKPYDAVIVDEAQDLAPTTLRLLSELVKAPGGLYFTADMSQSLYQRCFSWHHLQEVIPFPGETHYLKQSYRATESIFKACVEVAHAHRIKDDDIVQTQPNTALKGDKPTIVLMDDCFNQPKVIKEFLTKSAKRWETSVYNSAVLCPSRLVGKIMAQQLTTLGLKAEYLEGKEIDLQKACIKVMSIYDAKGLEFPFVAVVGLEEGLLPNLAGMPHQEQDEVLHEQAKLFYVACSRAMRSLRVYGSRLNPSRFVTALLKNSAWNIIKD